MKVKLTINDNAPTPAVNAAMRLAAIMRSYPGHEVEAHFGGRGSLDFAQVEALCDSFIAARQ